MPQYVLLLHEPSTAAPDLSPDEIQAIIERYKNWAEGIAARGHLRDGHKLQDGTGRILRNSNGRIDVSDGPYAETKEVIGGLFIIEADSYDQAVELSGTCPHLDAGWIEVREVEPT